MNPPNLTNNALTRPSVRRAAGFTPWLLLASLSLLASSAGAETVYKYTNSQGDTVFTDQPTKGAQKITIDPPPVIPLTPINLPPATPAVPLTATPLPNTVPNAAPVPSMQMPQVPANNLANNPANNPAITLSGTPPLPQGDSLIHMAPPSAPSGHPMIIRSPLPESAAPAVPRVIPNGHYQSLLITEPPAGPVSAREGGTIFVQVKLEPTLDVTAGDRMRLVIDGGVQVDDSTGQRFMLNNITNGSHTLIAIVMRHGQNIYQSNPVVIQVSGGLPPSSSAPK